MALTDLRQESFLVVYISLSTEYLHKCSIIYQSRLHLAESSYATSYSLLFTPYDLDLFSNSPIQLINHLYFAYISNCRFCVLCVSYFVYTIFSFQLCVIFSTYLYSSESNLVRLLPDLKSFGCLGTTASAI